MWLFPSCIIWKLHRKKWSDCTDSLNLKVVGEGVETKNQFEFLRNCECDEVQGNLFSQPVPADKVPELLREDTLVH